VFLAFGIEFGSGLGFWLAFGHDGSGRRDRVSDQVSTCAVAPPPEPVPVAEEPVMIDTPSEAVGRFLLECCAPRWGNVCRRP